MCNSDAVDVVYHFRKHASIGLLGATPYAVDVDLLLNAFDAFPTAR